jgi:hypothetical protein
MSQPTQGPASLFWFEILTLGYIAYLFLPKDLGEVFDVFVEIV